MSELLVRELGRQVYEPVWRAMQDFTNKRDESTQDEIWFCEHDSVFTLGLNSAPEHLLAPGNIPVIQIDRGGQVTYHGPGQLMIYPLIDLRRTGLGVRDLVTALEQSVVDLGGLRHRSSQSLRCPGRLRRRCQTGQRRPAYPARLQLSRHGAKRRRRSRAILANQSLRIQRT